MCFQVPFLKRSGEGLQNIFVSISDDRWLFEHQPFLFFPFQERDRIFFQYVFQIANVKCCSADFKNGGEAQRRC